jgi:hypothetical protein
MVMNDSVNPNGWLKETGVKKVVCLSPHADDAIWSCFATLDFISAVLPVQVVTLTAGSPPNSIVETVEQTFSADSRRNEELCIFKDWKISLSHLHFIDALFRTDSLGERIYSWETLWQFPLPQDSLYLDELFFTLKMLLAPGEPTLILTPLGFGDHVDHLAATLVARRLQTQFPSLLKLAYYEDFPYVWDQGKNWGKAATPSQIASRWDFSSSLSKISFPFERDQKRTWMLRYHSQSQVFFGLPGGLESALDHYRIEDEYFETLWVP